MSQPTIRSVAARPVVLPLEEPFVIASGKKERIENVLVEIRLDDGTRGLGEASPLEPINGENAATVIAVVETLADALVGRDVGELDDLAAMMRAVFRPQAAARAALEMALFDAWARVRRTSPWTLLGAAEATLETDYTIGIGDVARAGPQARALVARGFRKLKLKVGGDPERDLGRALAVVRAAPEAELQLDANEGFDADGAVRFIEALGREGVHPTLFEQPVPREDVAGMARVRRRTDVPVAADETVFFVEDAVRVAEAEAADVINIKLMKSGLVEGRRIHGVCREAGIGLMIGCMLESRLGMTAAVQFAAGLGGFTFVDLDPHAAGEEPFVGGLEPDGAVYRLRDVGPGWGVDLRTD